MLVALRIAYDGSAFDSYARQPGRRTVEGALVHALQGEGFVEGSLRTGSRTDAGVSASENVLQAQLDRPHLKGLLPALQKALPRGLWATGAAVAPEGFDPRKAAWREYRYLAPARGETLAVLQEAGQAFQGTHDFRAFARMEAHRDPRRTVLDVAVSHDGPFWAFHVRGQSFLWGQVRRMVDAALACGRGEATVADIREALASGRKHARFAVAPAEGLQLRRVQYDGLRWDPEAGVPRAAAEEALAARTRLDVVQHVASLGESA